MASTQKLSHRGYTVKLRDGTLYALNEANGFDLKLKWLEADKPFPVELDDDCMMSSQIVKISKNKVTASDVPPVSPQRQLVGRKCKAKHSIQREINRFAESISGKESEHNPDRLNWLKLVGDKDWREMMYKELRKSGALWCDDRTGECACEDMY